MARIRQFHRGAYAPRSIKHLRPRVASGHIETAPMQVQRPPKSTEPTVQSPANIDTPITQTPTRSGFQLGSCPHCYAVEHVLGTPVGRVRGGIVHPPQQTRTLVAKQPTSGITESAHRQQPRSAPRPADLDLDTAE